MTHPGSGNPIWVDDPIGNTPITSDRLNAIEDAIDGVIGGGTTDYATPEQYGAIGNGVTDDTTAINNALAAHTFVQMAAKTYAISGRINVPSNTTLAGRGGLAKGSDNAATTLKCTGSGAGVTAAGGGTLMTDFMVDGNSISTNPILIGATAAPWYAYSACRGIAAKNANGDNWRIYGTQNGSLINCNSVGGTRGLVLDYGAGGWLFNRFEVDGPSSHGLVFLNTPAGTLFPNTFIQCIFERRSTDGPIVLITAANQQTFYHCTFSTQQVTATTPLVQINSNGTQDFHSPVCTIQNGQAAFAVKGIGFGPTAPSVRFSGAPGISGFTTPAYFLDVDSQGFVTMDCWALNTVSGQGQLRTATSPEANIAQYQTTARYVLRTNATDPTLSQILRGETQPRFAQEMSGKTSWGPGGSTAPDTFLTRISSAALALTGSLAATGAVTAPNLSVDVQSFAASGTWTKPSGGGVSPKLVQVRLWGSGGGGGSGARLASGQAACGGGGGGGGGFTERWFFAGDLTGTVAVTVATGGGGGAAITADNTNGNPGGAGGNTLFGAAALTYFAQAAGGGAGGGGGNAAAGSAGTAGSGGVALGAAGGASSATGGAGNGGASAFNGGAGGGSGGGVTTTPTANNGGAGGSQGGLAGSGGGAAGTAPGGNGGTATSFPAATLSGPGTGGGGGAGATAAAGGTGSTGGLAGAGGGGGGASLNGNNSGAGGAGANGYAEVITYY